MSIRMLRPLLTISILFPDKDVKNELNLSKLFMMFNNSQQEEFQNNPALLRLIFTSFRLSLYFGMWFCTIKLIIILTYHNPIYFHYWPESEIFTHLLYRGFDFRINLLNIWVPEGMSHLLQCIMFVTYEMIFVQLPICKTL